MVTNHLTEHELLEFADGASPVSERPRMQAHLAECAVCTRTVKDLQSVRQRVAQVPPLSLPDGFASAVAQEIRSRTQQEDEWSVIEKLSERILTGIAVVVLILMAASAFTDAQADPVESRSSGLYDLYFQDSTVMSLVTAESISRDDILAAAIIREEGAGR